MSRVRAEDVRVLRGNRIWVARTRDGDDVLQKLYVPHGRGPRYWVRLLLERVLRVKTPTTAAARKRTEAALLAAWREAGCDVPADLSARHPELVHPGVTLLERVRGPLLLRLLGKTSDRAARDELLRRFAAAWGARHALAVERPDARLVQEHGTFLHVIVSGDRLVTFDLEQAFLPRRDVLPLVAREVEAYLRSLAKGADHEVFRADIETLVDAYPRRELLAAAVREYLDCPRAWRRLVWRIDRRVRRDRRRPLGKYRVLEVLGEALERRGVAPPGPR